MHGPDARVAREGRTFSVRARVAVLTAFAVAFSTFTVPALADISQGDIRSAEAAAAEAEAALGDARDALAAGVRRLERLEESLSSVRDRIEEQGEAIAEGQAEARDRIARMYMSAGSNDTSGLGLAGIGDLPAHIAYLGALAEEDRRFVAELAATRADLRRLQGSVEESISDQEAVVADLEAVVDDRQAALEKARSEVSAVAAEWERQEAERRAREEAERQRLLEEERRRQEAEEQARREEEERKQAALAAMAAAAASASAAGWKPGAGVEPWRSLVVEYFPPELVEDALSVMWCESKGDPLAINKYSAASGLFQHLPFYWPSRSRAAGWEGADVFDPEANVAVAAWLVNRTITIEQREPWGHWACKP